MGQIKLSEGFGIGRSFRELVEEVTSAFDDGSNDIAFDDVFDQAELIFVRDIQSFER